jgi:hypothetical protein
MRNKKGIGTQARAKGSGGLWRKGIVRELFIFGYLN